VPRPKWFHPRQVVLDCAATRASGGDGTGPDCVFSFSSRVINVKGLDLFVIFFYIAVLFGLLKKPKSIGWEDGSSVLLVSVPVSYSPKFASE
jgi:hypothetical protein